LPTSLAKAAAVVNTSCDADDVDGRGSPPYSARERERLCIVGLAIVVLAIVVLAIVVFAAVGRAIVGVGRRAVIARAPDLTWRVMVVLMIVRMLIGLFAGSMQACSLCLESPQALSAPLSDERKVARHVHTSQRAYRQRFGAFVSAGRQQERDNDQRRRNAD